MRCDVILRCSVNWMFSEISFCRLRAARCEFLYQYRYKRIGWKNQMKILTFGPLLKSEHFLPNIIQFWVILGKKRFFVFWDIMISLPIITLFRGPSPNLSSNLIDEPYKQYKSLFSLSFMKVKSSQVKKENNFHFRLTFIGQHKTVLLLIFLSSISLAQKVYYIIQLS